MVRPEVNGVSGKDNHRPIEGSNILVELTEAHRNRPTVYMELHRNDQWNITSPRGQSSYRC
jgi:hypothetical protein